MSKPERLTYLIIMQSGYVDTVHADMVELSQQGDAVFTTYYEEHGKNDDNMKGEPMYVPRVAYILRADQWQSISQMEGDKMLHKIKENLVIKTKEAEIGE